MVCTGAQDAQSASTGVSQLQPRPAYAVKLAASSRPSDPNAPEFVKEWISWGAGTRAAQALVLAGKGRALWHSRAHVTKDDIVQLAPPVLRHRVLLNYRAEAQGETVETIIQKLLDNG